MEQEDKVTDNKLEKLIEKYAYEVGHYNTTMGTYGSSYIAKTKQAIIDYVEKEKQEALKPIREVWEKLVEDVGIDTANAMAENSVSWRAIKTTLGVK